MPTTEFWAWHEYLLQHSGDVGVQRAIAILGFVVATAFAGEKNRIRPDFFARSLKWPKEAQTEYAVAKAEGDGDDGYEPIDEDQYDMLAEQIRTNVRKQFGRDVELSVDA